MSSKVAFPAPPPTTNCLTSQQRAQRLRTTKKLEQVLGSTPEWVDFARTSSNDHPCSHIKSLSKRKPSRLSRSASFSSLSAMIAQVPSLPMRKPSPPPLPPTSSFIPKKPLLQIPAPSHPRPLIPRAHHHSPSSFIPVSSSSPTSVSQTPPSPTESSSTSTLFGRPTARNRREKMERLRRRLGHDVPVTVVFPGISEKPEHLNDAQCRSSDDVVPSFIQSSTPLPVLIPESTTPSAPFMVPQSQKTYSLPPSMNYTPSPTKSRFASARDSLIVTADRQAQNSRRHVEPSSKLSSSEYASAHGDFLSLGDDTDEEEEEIMEVSIPSSTPTQEESKETRIATWAELVSAASASRNQESEWFEESDEDDLDDSWTQLSSPSDGSGPPSPQSLSSGKFVRCRSDFDDILEDDASAAFLLRYQGNRWHWGVPYSRSQEDVKKRISGVNKVAGLEALALSGMIF